MIGTICVQKVLARILGSQKGFHICFSKCHLIVYNCNFAKYNLIEYTYINTLRTGDADLRFYIITVRDG